MSDLSLPEMQPHIRRNEVDRNQNKAIHHVLRCKRVTLGVLYKYAKMLLIALFDYARCNDGAEIEDVYL